MSLERQKFYVREIEAIGTSSGIPKASVRLWQEDGNREVFPLATPSITIIVSGKDKIKEFQPFRKFWVELTAEEEL